MLWSELLPDIWELLPLKRIVELKTDRVTGNSIKKDYIGLENIESWTGRLLKTQLVVAVSNDEANEQGVVSSFESGDILFGKLRPYLAKAYLAEEAGICTTELLVMKPHENVDGRFLINILLTHEFIERVNAETFGAKMPRADWNTIGNIPIPMPSLNEQRAIAHYLDRQTAKIDTLITAKQRLLKLLTEKRRSLITHTVTRGLNPGVPLCDSGIEWLGEVPEHWKIFRIKHIGRVGNGSTPLRDNDAYWQDGTFPWLTSTVVNNNVVDEPTEFVTEIALRECHLPIVEPGSVLVAITGEGKTRGKAALLPYQATINQHMAFISPRTGLILPEFLQLYLAGSYKILRMISEGTGSTKGALTCEQIGEFPIPLPPLDEQNRIISKLTSMEANIDSLGKVTLETIELLQERRTALITAAVSGKIDISGAS
jgi:type I restriction enzyme S subunit